MITWHDRKFKTQVSGEEYACGTMRREAEREGKTVSSCGAEGRQDGYYPYIETTERTGAWVALGLIGAGALAAILYFALRPSPKPTDYGQLLPPEQDPYMTEEDIFYHGA